MLPTPSGGSRSGPAALDARPPSAGAARRLHRPKFARGRTSANASRSRRTASWYVLGQRLQRSWRALPQGRLSPNSEVTAPGSLSSVGSGGRDAPAPIEGGREGGGRALPAPPHRQLGPAAPSRPPAPTALARPRWWRRLLPARARGRRRRRRRLPHHVLPLPLPALHPPPPPPASATSTPRALSHWEIPLLLHSPLRLPPTRGRVTQIPAWAAAGRGRGRRPPGRARPLPAAPSAESGGRPIRTAAGRNQVGAREGAAPASPASGWGRGREGGKRGWRAGGRRRRLGPALQLPSEMGRFAIKKEFFFFLKCEVPNIVFQRARPAKSISPGRLTLKKNIARSAH